MLDETIDDAEAPTRSAASFTSSSLTPAVVVGLLVAAVRFFVSRSRTTFAIWPDEPAQLAMARFLGGGTRWTMLDHSTWKPGYALLISPIHWFTNDATTVFRSAMAINAVLGGIAATLLVVLARRLTSLSPWGAAVAAAVVMLTPGALFATDFVWSESLLVPLFLGAVIALIRFDESPSLLRACGAALLCTAAFATHSRVLPLTAVLVATIIVATARTRLSRRDAALSLGFVVGGFVFVQWSAGAIVDRLWRFPAETNTSDAVLERATDIGPVLIAAAGQWWYLAVSSLGIVGFGVWALARGIRSGDARTRSAGLIVAASVLGCVALSAVFMSARPRTDRVVYGRYNDAVMGPVLVMGIALLVGYVSRKQVAAAAGIIAASIAGTGALLVRFRDETLASSNGLEPMILGLQPFIDGADSIDVVPITIAALVLLVAVAALGALPHGEVRWYAPMTVFVVGVLVIGGASTSDAIELTWSGTRDASAIQALATGPLDGDLDVDFYIPANSDDTRALMAYQFALADTEFTVVEDVSEGQSALIVAPSDTVWPTDRPASPVWDDPTRPLTLWQRTGD